MLGDFGTGTPPAPGPALGEQILAFAGALLVAVYVREDPEDEDGLLRLAGTAGGGADRYGLPERYSLTGGSPTAEAVAKALGTGRPQWLNAAGSAAWYESASSRETPPEGYTDYPAFTAG